MLKNFSNLIQESLDSIILETYQRFPITLIAYICNKITDNFTLPYVKGETGKKVLQELQTNGHSYGAQYQNGYGQSQLSDENYKDYEQYDEIGNDILETCYRYWNFRKEKDSSQFVKDCADPFINWKNYMLTSRSCYKTQWEQVKIGLITYAICAAMKNKNEKIAKKQ